MMDLLSGLVCEKIKFESERENLFRGGGGNSFHFLIRLVARQLIDDELSAET